MFWFQFWERSVVERIPCRGCGVLREYRGHRAARFRAALFRMTRLGAGGRLSIRPRVPAWVSQKPWTRVSAPHGRGSARWVSRWLLVGGTAAVVPDKSESESARDRRRASKWNSTSILEEA